MQKLVKSLELRNIGRVEHELIEFGMLTRVEGENQAGKSVCIYDTLEIGMLGSSFPESLVREGFREGSFRITFTDGSWTEVTRSGNKQRRVLGWPDGQTKEFNTVSDKEVIEEVQAFTGCREMVFTKELGKESFQFIHLDAPQTDVILRMEPKSVLRRITKIVGGTGAETAKQKLESELRKLNTQKTVQSEIVKQYEGRYELVWSQIDFAALEEDYRELAARRDTVERIAQRIETVKQLRAAQAEQEALLASVRGVYTASKCAKGLQRLSALQETISRTQKSSATIDGLLDQGERLDDQVAAALPFRNKSAAGLTKLRALKESNDRATERCQVFTQLLSNRDSVQREITTMKVELQAIEKQIKEYVPPMASMCPTCGQPTPGDPFRDEVAA